jgi:hypothetical protein
MGYRSLIAKQVQGAMKILGTDSDGLATKQTYVSVAENAGVYDPVTRTVTTSETVQAGVPMVLVRFKVDDMDDQVRPKTDRRALIAALDLNITPSPQDYITLVSGENYAVVRLLSDPSDSLHILHVRYVDQAA